jgi:hypothetical protein
VKARRRGTTLLAVVAVTGGLLVSACDPSPEQSPQALTTATVPADRATQPQGWVTRQGAGFRVSIPGDWADRPPELRAVKQAALEVGVPFTGQRHVPPVLIVFVEREQVGPLSIREPLVRAQLPRSLPAGATLGESKHVAVAGSTDAVEFDVLYDAPGGESKLGTPIDPTAVRQRELLVETPGLPKYGLRYAAPLDEFDEGVWAKILGSFVVEPPATDAAGTDA